MPNQRGILNLWKVINLHAYLLVYISILYAHILRVIF